MAFVIVQRFLPPIWQHTRGVLPFLPPVAVATLVNGQFQDNPAALLSLSDQKDRTSLSGLLQLSLPDGRLVLVGRGRGNPAGVTLGGAPLLLVPLGLDAAPPEAPRGFFPWTARVESGGVLVLDLMAFKLSDLRVRVR